MCSASRNLLMCVAIVVLSAAVARAGNTPIPTTHPAPRPLLKVVADPNNLPFSNGHEEGFENKIARLIADDLGATLEYTWYAQHRGYIRNTIKHGDCDLVMGVPRQLDMLLTTNPYYRSSYCFVYRADRGLDVSSFDDPILRTLKIGVTLIGDDSTNSPPAHCLGQRGIITNVVGFSVYSDYSQPNPPARIIDAVGKGDVDVSIAWGPLAGYFAKQQPATLKVVPVQPQQDGAYPLAFDISIGVRKKNTALRDQLNDILVRRHADIDRILDSYDVPQVPAPAQSSHQIESKQ